MANNVLVKDIMSKDLIVVENETSAREVVSLMAKNDIDAVLVVQSGKPTGIITNLDVLIRAIDSGATLTSIIARMIYTNPLVTIEESATLEEAANLMLNWKIHHLPVTQKGKLVGMVTYIDLAFSAPALLPTLKELWRPTK
jgi:CBS domain-containing protein